MLFECINVYSSTDPPRTPSVSVNPPGDVIEGNTVTLTCNSDAKPAVTFTWYKDGSSIYTGHQLVKENVSPADSGRYTCLTRNKHGDKQSPPHSLEVQCKSTKSLYFKTCYILQNSSIINSNLLLSDTSMVE